MTTTLSYYAQHYLKLYNEDGTERKLRETEISLIRMMEQAWQHNAHIKQVTIKGHPIWQLQLNKETMQQIRPLHNYVVVRPDEAQDKLGGLHLPDSAQKKPKIGTVLFVGPGEYQAGTFIPTTVKAGDKVKYSKFAGTTDDLNGEEVVLLKEQEILIIL